MTNIKQADLIKSVADAFQFISYLHPKDFIQAMGRAYELEKGEAAKDAIAQILTKVRCARLENARFAKIQVLRWSLLKLV